MQNDLLPNKMLKMLSALLDSTLVLYTSMQDLYLLINFPHFFIFFAGKQKYVLSVALFYLRLERGG